MTTQLDLNAAKQKAGSKSDEDLELAAGHAGNALDGIVKELWADPDLDAFQKAEAYDAIRANARNIVQAALSGSNLTAGALGGGKSTPTDPDSVTLSKDDYDELVNEKGAAVAQNKVWKESRETLDKVSLDLNLQIPHDSNLPYPKDFDKKILKAIEDKETAAAQAAIPPEMVAEADVKSALAKIKEGEKDLSSSYGSNKVTGGAKLDEGIAELEQLVS